MIGNILKAHRVKYNLYQSEMASLIGLYRANYSRIEANKADIKWSTVLKVIEVVAPEVYQQLLVMDLDADTVLKKNKNIKRIKV